jgi:hypothetical protein
VLHEADNEKGGPLLLRKFNYNKLHMELSHAGARRFVFTRNLESHTHTHMVLMCGSRAVYALMVDFEPAPRAPKTALSDEITITKQATPAALI